MKNSPEVYHFTDDGTIPKSKHPVLIYLGVFNLDPDTGADWLEGHFAQNSWTNVFRWGICHYLHYHCNTHEILGVYAGDALLQLGGEHDEQITVSTGDIVILPAETGHISLEHIVDFALVGAYSGGKAPDLIKITDERPKGEREKSDSVPLPENDQLHGKAEGLLSLWK